MSSNWVDRLPASERAELRDAGRIGGSRFEPAHIEVQPLLVPVKDAAVMLGGIDEDKVYAMCNSGQLPHIRLGRRILVSVEGMKEWIKQNDGREALAF